MFFAVVEGGFSGCRVIFYTERLSKQLSNKLVLSMNLVDHLRIPGIDAPACEDRKSIADTRVHLTLPRSFSVARELEKICRRNRSSAAVSCFEL